MGHTSKARMCVYVNTAGVSAHTSIPASNKQSPTALNLENKNTESDSAQNKVSSAFPGQTRRSAFLPPRQTDKEKKIRRP
jgi:hypothetical protein